ncbi:MAG: ribonuclease P protein component [Candidatus Dormibacteria bacterium]
MTSRHRLRGRRRFRDLRASGVRVACGDVRLTALSNGGVQARVGFALPGQRSAVERNLLRRRLREAMRPLLAGLAGHDVLVSLPASAAATPYARLSADLAAAATRVLRRSRSGRTVTPSENGGVKPESPS